MRARLSLRLILFSSLFFIPFLGAAQTFRQLGVRDFNGTPTENGYAAYTYCYVSYSYQPTRRNGVYNIDFDVRLMMDPSRSWIRYSDLNNTSLLQDVLKHEQGHYNIAYLMRNELYSVLSRHRYTANYQSEIAALFREVDSRYKKMNADYENQTEHMANAGNQQKWNLWFSRQLNTSNLASNY